MGYIYRGGATEQAQAESKRILAQAKIEARRITKQAEQALVESEIARQKAETDLRRAQGELSRARAELASTQEALNDAEIEVRQALKDATWLRKNAEQLGRVGGWHAGYTDGLKEARLKARADSRR